MNSIWRVWVLLGSGFSWAVIAKPPKVLECVLAFGGDEDAYRVRAVAQPR